MFTSADIRSLLDARPFVPFRLILTDGGSVDIRHREFAMPFRRFVIVGIPDAQADGADLDRYVTVFYMHISRVEMLSPGAPPFTEAPPSPPPGPAVPA